MFHEVRGIERSLFQHLVSAIDSSYLATMQNRTTSQFIGTVFDTLQHLITTYGEISPSQLNQLESDTKLMTYDQQTPVDIVSEKWQNVHLATVR